MIMCGSVARRRMSMVEGVASAAAAQRMTVMSAVDFFVSATTGKDHLKTSCVEANCYHCGWGGAFPPPFDPKLTGWAKAAFAAG